jgi:hypothetical protein
MGILYQKKHIRNINIIIQDSKRLRCRDCYAAGDTYVDRQKAKKVNYEGFRRFISVVVR